MSITPTLFGDLWKRLTPEEKNRAMRISGIKSRSTMNSYTKNPGLIRIDSLTELLPFLSQRFNTEITWKDLLSQKSFEEFISKTPVNHG